MPSGLLQHYLIGTSSPGDATQWLRSNSVPKRRFEKFEPFSSFYLCFLLYLFMSCKGVLVCSTRFMVCSGTGFVYLAVHRQGAIVYKLSIYAAGHLPRNFPASFRRRSSLNTIVPTCRNNLGSILPTWMTTKQNNYHLVFGAPLRTGVHALPSRHATLQGDIGTNLSRCYGDPYIQGVAGTPTTQEAMGL